MQELWSNSWQYNQKKKTQKRYIVDEMWVLGRVDDVERKGGRNKTRSIETNENGCRVQERGWVPGCTGAPHGTWSTRYLLTYLYTYLDRGRYLPHTRGHPWQIRMYIRSDGGFSSSFFIENTRDELFISLCLYA